MISWSQIPVTDAASAGILANINTNAIANSKLIGQMISNQQQVIENQNTLIRLMKEQNRTIKHTDDLKTEEINTYKKAPDANIVSYQIHELNTAKRQLIGVSKDFVAFIKSADNLKPSDYKTYENKVKTLIKEAVMAFEQTKNLLRSTSVIIPARERQELLQNTISNMKKHVTTIKSFEKELDYINKKRGSNNRFYGN